MTPEAQKKYDEKLKRIKDAVELREPDRVPLNLHAGIYPIFNAGYTVAEVVYDTSLEKIKNATIKYLNDFDPDVGTDVAQNLAGEGPAQELLKPKNNRWAGMPGNIINENSFTQHVEFPILFDDEYDEYWNDRAVWTLTKAFPRTSGLLEPFEHFMKSIPGPTGGARAMASLFSKPEYKQMIQDFWAIEEFYQNHAKRVVAANKEIEELGYPMIRGRGGGGSPFDGYSNWLRGTIWAMEDMINRPEDIQRYLDETIEVTLANIAATKGVDEGKHVFMALHKGMDAFMNDEQYKKFYWKYLQQVILAIIDAGRIPYVYTEGKYNSRLDYLTEVPPGKVFYHFETVDMAVAAKKFAGIACIGGGFPVALLDWQKPEVIREEVKRLLDICMPGGGFIFEATAGMGNCKRENVEAMFETVKEFGVY